MKFRFAERTITVSLVGLLFCLSAEVSQAQKPISIVPPQRNTPVNFDKDILPILRANCLACHSATEAQGELVLETPQGILKGGESGAAAVPKKSAESLLLKLASHRDEKIMPPADNDVSAKNLTPQQLGLIKLWIDQGASGAPGSGVISPTTWRPLPKGVNPIYAVAVTPDGQYAACSRANQIFIYHVASGQLVTRLTDAGLQARDGDPRPGIAHLDVVQSLSFNPQGDMLASGGFRTVKLWQRPRDVQRHSISASTGTVSAVAVSPDGKTIATASADNTIKFFNAASGQAGVVLTGHTAAITSLRFSHDGEKLVSSSIDKTIRVWNVTDGKLMGRIDTPSEVSALTLVQLPPPPAPTPAADATGEEKEKSKAATPPPIVEQIVSGGGDNLIRQWIMPAGLSQPLVDVPAKTNVLAVSLDRKLLALANAEGAIQVIDVETGKPINAWQAHTGAVSDIAFAVIPEVKPPAANADNEEAPQENPQPPLRRLATAGADGTVRIWNYDSKEQLAVLRGTLAPITGVTFRPDGKQLAATTTDGGVTVWNLEATAPKTLAGDNGSPATVAAISNDGKLLATSGTLDGRAAILVRDVTSNRVIHTLLGHDQPITSLSFSADNTKIASGSADKTARVWELAAAKFPELMRFSEHTGPVTGVAFNADASQVLSGSADNSVKLWAVADGKALQNFAGHTAAIVGVGFATGNLPVSASADKTVRFWNAADGKQLRAITATTAVTTIGFTRDGARLALAGADNNIATYQTADGKLLQTLKGHQAAVKSLVFSADASRLVSAGADNRAIVWNSLSGRLLEMIPVEAGLTAAIAGPTVDTVVLADAKNGLQLQTLRFSTALTGMTQAVTAAVYHANGQTLYTACADGTVRGFNLTNAQQTFSANHGAPIHDLALSPNGLLLASAGEDKIVKLFNAANGAAAQPPQVTGFLGPVTSVAFSADSTRVVGGTNEATGQILVFRTAAPGALEQSLVGHAGAISALVTVGEKGEEIVSASADASVRRWQLLAVRSIAGHTQPVSSLAAVSNVPLQAVSGSADGSLRHWNLTTGQLVRQFNHGAPVTSVAARIDGQRFASTSTNNTVKLWNATNGQQLAEMKGDLRARATAAKLAQQKTATENKIKLATDKVAAVEKDAPTKATAATTAATALAAADKDLATKKDTLAKAVAAKEAAEKVAIEAAANAQKAAQAKAQADTTALEAAALAKQLTDKATQAKAAATANPTDKTLAQISATADAAAAAATQKAQLANTAKTVPTKTATDAATAANAAVTKALATGKPYTDALTAVRASEAVRNTAATNSEIAQKESKAAADAIPIAKADLVALQALQKKLETDLAAATLAVTAAEKPQHTVAFSPDGSQLATGGEFGAVHTWDSENGSALSSYVGHTATVRGVAYTADDGLVTIADDKTAAVWELNPGWMLTRTIGKIEDPTILINRVSALDFSDDGSLLVTGSGEPSRSGEVKIWKVADGSLLTAIPDAHTDCVNGVAFSRDAKYVASAGSDKFVRAFDVATGKQVQTYEGHTNYALDVSWRADGRRLVSCGADNVIRVWNAETGDRIRAIAGFTKQVTSVRFIGESGNTVACAGDANVRMHTAENGANFRNFAGSVDFMYGVDVTPDSRIVAAGGYDGVLRLWNGTNAQVLKAIAAPVEPEEAEKTAQTEVGEKQAAK